MKISHLLILLLLPLVTILGQSTVVDYTIIGNESREYATDLDTLNKAIYLVGNTNECGNNNGFIVKYKDDSIYQRTLVGDINIDIIESIETTNSNTIFLGGYTNKNNDYDVYLAKLDTNLLLLDTKTLELDNWNFCHDLAIQSSSIIGVGETHNNTDYDAFMFKTDNNLDTIWTKSIARERDQKLTKVVAYNDSIFIACGYTEIDGLAKDILLVSFNANTGDTLWTNHYGGVNDDFCSSLIKTNDGGIAGFGTTSSFNSTTEDTYLFKTDSTGLFLWSNLHQVQTSQNVYADNGIDLIQLQNNDFVVAASSGSFGNPGVNSIFIIKTNSEGDYSNGYIYDGGKDNQPVAIVKNNENSFTLAGVENTPNLGYIDAYILEIENIAASNTIEIDTKYITKTCFTTVNSIEKKIGLSVYPNPISHFFTIESSTNEKVSMTIYSSLGIKVFEGNLSTNKQLQFPNKLSKGHYLLQIKSKNKVEYLNIIYAQ